MFLNKVMIVGNLTRDPEMKAMPNGNKVTAFSVATNEVYKDKNGVKQEKVEYHNIVVFGRQAETSAQYLKKGQSVLIEGKIQTRSWDDKTTGEKKYRTEIVANLVQFGHKAGGNTAPADQKPAVEGQGADLDNIDFGDTSGDDIDLDDIPF